MTKNEFDRVKELLEHAAYSAYLDGLTDAMKMNKDAVKEPSYFKIDGGAELLLRRELNRR